MDFTINLPIQLVLPNDGMDIDCESLSSKTQDKIAFKYKDVGNVGIVFQISCRQVNLPSFQSFKSLQGAFFCISCNKYD